jgi:RNA-directed DNA polymerase
VFDSWFDRDVKPRLSSKSRLIRYADDIVILFANESDARRVLEVLPQRFGKYGLTLHPEKTKLVGFRRPDRYLPNRGGPGTFDVLGFTHYWSKSRSNKVDIKRKTAKDRFRRALQRVAQWCREHRHESIREQQKALGMKLQGHFAYFGITGNSAMLALFLREVEEVWRKWLNRRSQLAPMPWERMHRLLKRYPLPRPRIVHPYLPRAANP